MLNPILFSNKSNEWYTPARYVEAARLVMGSIELDPASCEDANRTVKAERYFNINGLDGLACAWIAKTVWLNPPYSNVKEWVNRLIHEYENGWALQAILLVNASTSERWFQPLWDYPICFTNHRIKFIPPVPILDPKEKKKGPTKGNAFIYFGRNEARYTEVFRQFGPIVGRLA